MEYTLANEQYKGTRGVYFALSLAPDRIINPKLLLDQNKLNLWIRNNNRVIKYQFFAPKQIQWTTVGKAYQKRNATNLRNLYENSNTEL